MKAVCSRAGTAASGTWDLTAVPVSDWISSVKSRSDAQVAPPYSVAQPRFTCPHGRSVEPGDEIRLALLCDPSSQLPYQGTAMFYFPQKKGGADIKIYLLANEGIGLRLSLYFRYTYRDARQQFKFQVSR